MFIDDELVLDIGGIHQPVTGTINFTTGEIIVHGVDTITKTFDVGGHTLKMFYLERGGCDSNLSVRFNLPLTMGNGSVKLIKKSMTNDTTEPDQPLKNATFGIWENADCTGEPYIIVRSDENGILDIVDLPIKEDNQKYYLKEIAPPEGYMLNSTIFTLELKMGGDGTPEIGEDGNYIFRVTSGGADIDVADNYAVIRDDRPADINLSVEKQWQDATGEPITPDPGLEATFELRRYKTPIHYDFSTVVELNVYRVDSNWNIIEERFKHYYAGNTTAYVDWTFNQYYGWDRGIYRVDDSGDLSKGSSPAEIQLPDSGVVNVYIFDGNYGTQYQAYGLETVTVTGTEGSSHSSTEVGERVLDEDFSGTRRVTLPNDGSWSHVFSDLPIQETDEDDETTIYLYEYFIVEVDDSIPDGYEVIYVDGNGNPISDPSSLSTNVSGTQTVINRKKLSVPIEKHWPDFSGDEFEWTATFQLEEKEVKVNEEDPDASDANTEDWIPVAGREELTISKGQTPAPEFEDLPMYRVHSNGTVYRIMYSVTETAYEVKEDGEIIFKWNEDDGVIVGADYYTPQYDQDAGEHGDSLDDYMIIVKNTLHNIGSSEDIDIEIEKEWPEASEIPGAYATFVLKRYRHIEHRDYTKAGAEWVTVTMVTYNSPTGEVRKQELEVPVGTKMYIVGEIRPGMNANKIVFSRNDGGSVELIQDNSQNDSPAAFSMEFTAADSDMTVTLTQGDNYVVGGREGFRLSDSYGDKTPDEPDDSFEEHFTLNAANDWYKLFEALSVVEEDTTKPTQGTQNIYVYSYYLEEVECSPADFAPTFKDSAGNILGNQENRISFDTTITATNNPKTTDITVKKVDVSDLGKDNPELLKNAAFRIEKYTSSTYQQLDASWGEGGKLVMTQPSDGLFKLDGLSTGYYKIVETAFPDGYIRLTTDPTFQVKVDSSGKLSVEFDSGTSTGVVTVMTDGTIQFGNTPGTALPMTGGIGTQFFYMIGLVLMIAASILYTAKKER